MVGASASASRSALALLCVLALMGLGGPASAAPSPTEEPSPEPSAEPSTDAAPPTDPAGEAAGDPAPTEDQAAADAEAQRLAAERAEASRVEAERAAAALREAQRLERQRIEQERTVTLTERLATAAEELAASERGLVSALAARNRVNGDLVVGRLDLDDARMALVASRQRQRAGDAELARAERELAIARRDLAENVAAAYRAGSTAANAPLVAVDALVSTRSPQDFVAGAAYLDALLGSKLAGQQVALADHEAWTVEAAEARPALEAAQVAVPAAEVAVATAEGALPGLERRLTVTIDAHAARAGRVSGEAAAQRAAAAASDAQPHVAANLALAEDLAELAEASAEVGARMRDGSSRITAGADGVAAWAELRCPVDGVVQFINDWGFPRSGGRSHEGTDVFAARGTPVVAMADGIVRRVSEHDVGLGGRSVTYETGGYSVYNAHLDAIAAGLAPGDDVVSGQVLGTVGTTGNARYTPPHDHLGIARADGAPVNPYPVLRRACRERLR